MSQPLFGILGGMGPLASTHFLASIYDACLDACTTEQEYPRVLLLSDPVIPDRVQALRNGEPEPVVRALDVRLSGLVDMGATEIIIACVTAHLFLHRLKATVANRVTSLTALLTRALDAAPGETLLLSSQPVHSLNLIKHPRLRRLDDAQAERVHRFIYRIKLGYDDTVLGEFCDFAGELAQAHAVAHVAFACTELHLATRFVRRHGRALPFSTIDPLQIAADHIVSRSNALRAKTS